MKYGFLARTRSGGMKTGDPDRIAGILLDTATLQDLKREHCS
jgi:hypothetical protein